VPDPPALYQALKRVTYDVKIDPPWTWAQVADALLEEKQAMVVLNTISDAEAVIDALPNDDSILHLSTRLCGTHRRRVLNEVRQRLDAGAPVRLVATQVVEAGVDISFPRVMRALGPLDSIIQAAGRCNREGERDTGHVTIFDPAEGGTPPGAYETGRDIARNLFAHTSEIDLHDPDWPRRYFEQLYDSRNLDESDVQALRADFQFQTVARRYRLIPDDTTPVVVNYGNAWDLLNEVAAEAQFKGFVHRADWRRLQPYTVTLYEHALQEGQRSGHVYEIDADLDLWRWDGGYDGGTLHKRNGTQGGLGLHRNGPSVSSLMV
jgi:CRISPR-associated endonuclease/helicase Cas3